MTIDDAYQYSEELFSACEQEIESTGGLRKSKIKAVLISLLLAYGAVRDDRSLFLYKGIYERGKRIYAKIGISEYTLKKRIASEYKQLEHQLEHQSQGERIQRWEGKKKRF